MTLIDISVITDISNKRKINEYSALGARNVDIARDVV